MMKAHRQTKKMLRVTSPDDPLEISCKDLARIACNREYLQEAYKNGVILQVQKSLASFLKKSCKETSDLLRRHFLLEKQTNQKFLARIFQDFAFLALFAIFCKNNALSCKKLGRILQVLYDRLTRDVAKWWRLPRFMAKIRWSSVFWSNEQILQWYPLCGQSWKRPALHKVCCRVALPGQSFVSYDSGRSLLQDEDHSGSRPHSFRGLCSMRSRTSP